MQFPDPLQHLLLQACRGLAQEGLHNMGRSPGSSPAARACACRDLAMPKFQWDAPMLPTGAAVPFSCKEIERSVSIAADPYQARNLL